MTRRASRLHEHFDAAIEHLASTPHADVVIACGGPDQAQRVFDDLASIAPDGARILVGAREVRTANGRIRVLASPNTRELGARPTLGVDYYARYDMRLELERSLTKSGGEMLHA